MMLANRNRFRRRHNLPYIIARRIADEGECNFDFGIEWKVFRAWKIKGGTRVVQLEAALIRALERADDVVRIAQIKVAGIHEYSPTFFGCSFKSPQNRFRKSFF